MKIYRAILHTGGKTPDQIREHDTQDYKDEETEQIIEYMNAWDGAEVFLADSFEVDKFIFIGNAEASEAKVKEAIWLMEQDPLFGCYIDAREEFDQVWGTEDYEPFGNICFSKEEVEILEEKSSEEPVRVTEIPFYFEISKNANMAHTADGKPIECYTKVNIHLDSGIYGEQVAAVQADNVEKVCRMLAEKMKLDIIHISVIDEDKYLEEVREIKEAESKK